MRIYTYFTALLLTTLIYTTSAGASDHGHAGHNHGDGDEKKSHSHEKDHGHMHESRKTKKTENKKDDHNSNDHEKDHGSENKKHDHDENDSDHRDEHDHGNHAASKFGKGKAIIEVKKDGALFKLSNGAINTMKIRSIILESGVDHVYEVPTSAIADFQDEIGVYRRTKDWFELIEVRVLDRSKYSAKIKSKKLLKGNVIVSEGVPLLRVAHLEASGQGGQGHVH